MIVALRDFGLMLAALTRARLASIYDPPLPDARGAILGLAATGEGTGKGALLLAAYSAGLALPLMFAAIAFHVATRAFGLFKHHYAAIQLGSGLVLVGVGVLVPTRELFTLNLQAQHLLTKLGLNFFQSV